MRTFVVAALAAVAVLSVQAPAHAVWCAYTQIGTTNCGFETQAQCLETLSGIGGVCSEQEGRGGLSALPSAKTRERAARTPPPARRAREVEQRRREPARPAVSHAPPASRPSTFAPASSETPRRTPSGPAGDSSGPSTASDM